jgi:hypothetical protein
MSMDAVLFYSICARTEHMTPLAVSAMAVSTHTSLSAGVPHKRTLSTHDFLALIARFWVYCTSSSKSPPCGTELIARGGTRRQVAPNGRSGYSRVGTRHE